MVSGSLALLYFLLGFHGGRQGSGPDRGRSPVEWGDFPSVRLSVCPSVHPFPPLGHPPRPWLRAGWMGLRPGWMAQRGGMDGWTDSQTNRWKDGRMNGQTDKRKISPFYRTLSPIGAAALPPPMKTKEKVEQGKGTADHLMPLGYLFCLFFFVFFP